MGYDRDFEGLRRRVLELENEASARARVEETLERRLKFEKLIASVSSKFINLVIHEIERGIDETLAETGRLAGADRCYLFRLSEDGTRMTNTNEWCAEGVKSQMDRLEDLPVDVCPWIMGRMKEGEVVDVPHVSQLPPEAAAERGEFEIEGIKSLILVPMLYRRRAVGFLGCDWVDAERERPEDVSALLKIIGEILAGTLERKRTEVALRAGEEKYRNILETIEEGYFEVDLEGNMTLFNESVCRILGRSREEVSGLNNRHYATPDDAKKMYQNFNLVYRTGEPVSVTDFAILTKDGERRVLELSISPVRDHDDEMIGFRGIARNVTERKLAEDRLKESEQRYRTVLEANPDPVIVYDMEGRVIYFNPAFTRVFGWTLEEGIGTRMDRYVPKETFAETKTMIDRVMAGESFSGIETIRLTKGGERIPVNMSGAIYRDRGGTPAGAVINIRDVSERKKMEAQLQYAQKMESIGTLAGGIAHDFNNLLMAIQGNVSLMLYDMDPNHPHHEGLVNIEKQIRSGANLTKQLLGYARKGRYELKAVDLNRLIRETAGAFGRTKKEITINQELAEDLCPVNADQGQIEQVLLNVFVNAWQAMPNGGALFLKTANIEHQDMRGKLYDPKPGAYVLLTVTDTGTGMDKATMTRIFEPFFTTKEMGRGTGLGLASVYGIVKGHGGYVDVDSKVGVGTTFYIYLPASRRKVLDGRIDSGALVDGSGTILLVDDEELILDIGARLMEKLGYTVLKARRGGEAVAIFERRQGKIDLVILDMIMPEMGGGETFDLIRSLDPKAKVLLSSGYSMDGQAKEIMTRGCNGFIQKPYRLDELSEKISEIISR